MRDKILYAAIAVSFVFLVLGLFSLQVLRGRYYRSLSNENRIRIIPEDGARGKIIDSQGDVLADNYLSFDIVVLPQELRDRESTFSRISPIIGMEVKDIKRVMKRDFLAPFAPITLKEDLPRPAVMLIKELAYELPGVEIQARPRRFYRFGSSGAHLLGYVNRIDKARLTKLKDYGYTPKDIVGYSGIEEYYDKFLRARDGGRQVEVDSRGRFVRLISFRNAVDGQDIVLTINLRMQRIVDSFLEGTKGAVVVMDPNTGGILAMSSFPSFDPNVFLRRFRSNEIRRLLANRDAPLLNRTIKGQYAPGSIFKMIVAYAGLEQKKIDYVTSFDCPGYFELGSRRFGCWERHGRQNLRQAIAHSCDVFFYNTALLVGADSIVEYARKFGVGHVTGIDLPYEASGFLPTPMWKRLSRFKGWYGGDTVNFSIGQGDLMMTPVQAALMISEIANGGYALKPYIVRKVGQSQLKRFKPVSMGLNKEFMDHIKKGLKDVVSSSSGTASLLSDIPGLSVAGKTGTAQVAGKLSHAWFVGYAPEDEPKIAFCVFLENGGSSSNACALTKKILNKFREEGLL